MDFTPGDKAKVREAAAKALEASLRREAGGITDLILMPLAAAAGALCMSPAQVTRNMKIVKIGPKKRFVRVSEVQRFLAANETSPR